MFGQLGEMAGLMKKFGEMQSKMKDVKAELAAMELTGRSLDGTVSVTLKGDLSCVTSVRISGTPGAGLDDSVREAINQALTQVRDESAKRLSEITGGLHIPGLM